MSYNRSWVIHSKYCIRIRSHLHYVGSEYLWNFLRATGSHFVFKIREQNQSGLRYYFTYFQFDEFEHSDMGLLLLHIFGQSCSTILMDLTVTWNLTTSTGGNPTFRFNNNICDWIYSQQESQNARLSELTKKRVSAFPRIHSMMHAPWRLEWINF